MLLRPLQSLLRRRPEAVTPPAPQAGSPEGYVDELSTLHAAGWLRDLDDPARRMGFEVVIAVEDDGPGIAAGDRLRLFEPFFTTRRAEGGTGLGLAIARSLLEAGGGTIDLAEGDATTFVVTLPVAPS